MRKKSRGHLVVWLLVVMASMSAGISSIAFARDEGVSLSVLLTFFASLAVAAVGLYLEGKHDFCRVAPFIAVVAVITALITGATAGFGEQSHPLAAGVAVLAGLTTVFCFGYLAFTQMRKEPLPNILRERFGRDHVYELDGVQFVAFRSRDELSAGDALEITVFAQNCFNAPRDFVFGLSQETRLSLNKAGYQFAKEAKLELGPAQVMAMTIIAVATGQAKGQYSLLASPKVSGSGGTRVRHWRAKALSRPIPIWLTAIGPLLGFIAWGGGMRFKTRVRPAAAGAVVHPQEVPPVTVESVWQLL
jgi:hypothetical protein